MLTCLLSGVYLYVSVALSRRLCAKHSSANVLNAAPRQDANEPNEYKADERPCPTCRGHISYNTLFSRHAFEPTNAELAAATGMALKDEDDDIIMIDDIAESDTDVKGKGKARARPAPGRTLRARKARPSRVVESSDEEDDDSMSDFIVDDDADEEDWEEQRDARREVKLAERNRGARRSTRRVVLSDDEDGEVIFGARPTVDIPKEKIALLPKFLPSTKMKVRSSPFLDGSSLTMSSIST